MNYSDSIETLPIDKHQPSRDELKILDTLFVEQRTPIKKFLLEMKEVIVVVLLFILFSLLPIDGLLQKIPTIGNHKILVLSAKALIVGVVFYILKRVYLKHPNN